MPEDKKTKQQKKIKVGDHVYAQGREPMPESMRKALAEKQVVTVAAFPFFEFESGWSVNVEMGDHIFLATPQDGRWGTRNQRRQAMKRYELHQRKAEREALQALKNKDAKAIAKAAAVRREERRKLRKAGLLYPRKQPV